MRGIVVHDLVEGYVSAVVLVDEDALRPVGIGQAQILLRVPAVSWPFGERSYAPEAVAAADLLDGNDSRSVAAGRAILAHAVEHQLLSGGVAK